MSLFQVLTEFVNWRMFFFSEKISKKIVFCSKISNICVIINIKYIDENIYGGHYVTVFKHAGQ